MFGMGGGSKGGAGNDVSSGAMAALNSRSGINFAPQTPAPAADNAALAPKGQQTGTSQQPDQLEQMINKLLGVWADRQKAGTAEEQGQAPTAQPNPVEQDAAQQTKDGWGPYSVPIPQQFQHYFQGAQNG